MLKVWQTLILGLVQGLTEFLPVSSSGHLILLEKLLGVDTEQLLFFNIMLHVGTLCAVVAVFWDDILGMIKKPFQKKVLLLVIATVPAVAVSLLLGDFIDAAFSGKFLGVCFIFTAVILYATEFFASNRHPRALEQMNWLDALFIGVAQAVAILPGVSRSGCTICAAMSQGVDRKDAGRFSMLMSLVAIIGSVVLEVPDVVQAGGLGMSVWALAAGVLAAAASGFFAIKLLMLVLKKGGLKAFSFYMLALGVATIAGQLIWHVAL